MSHAQPTAAAPGGVGLGVRGRGQPRRGAGRRRGRGDDARAALAPADAGRLSTPVDTSMAAQNAELKGRLAALSPLLVELAGELAGARRHSAVLRAENERLRARLAALTGSAALSSARAAVPRSPRTEA
jgi:hypothetical protein